MQAISTITCNRPYISGMPGGRPSTSKRAPFGERLFQLREERGLSQKQMAEKLSITQQSYAAWERRAVALKPEQMALLAAILDTTADSLLGRKADKTRGTGPVGRAKKLFDSISRLPRHQQEKVISILEPFVREHVNGK